MKYAQIKDGIVKNIIILNDANLIPTFSVGFDFLINVSEINCSPGFLYNSETEVFSIPVQTEEQLEAQIKSIVVSAKRFGMDLIDQYAVKNILAGKTPTQISATLAKCATVKALLETGSLYTALQAVQALTVDEITPQADIDWIVGKIQGYLGI